MERTSVQLRCQGVLIQLRNGEQIIKEVWNNLAYVDHGAAMLLNACVENFFCISTYFSFDQCTNPKGPCNVHAFHGQSICCM